MKTKVQIAMVVMFLSLFIDWFFVHLSLVHLDNQITKQEQALYEATDVIDQMSENFEGLCKAIETMQQTDAQIIRLY